MIFWDGQNWESPQQLLWVDGTPSGVAIWDIEIDAGDLYAFGTLFGASDATMRYLAKWDGSQWCGMQTSAWELGGSKWQSIKTELSKQASIGERQTVFIGTMEKPFHLAQTPVSVDEEAPLDFTIYPNPATNQLNLSWSTTTQGKALVRMTTLEGKIVLEEETNASQQHTIDTSALPEGFYLLTVQMNNQWYVEKVVVK